MISEFWYEQREQTYLEWFSMIKVGLTVSNEISEDKKV